MKYLLISLCAIITLSVIVVCWDNLCNTVWDPDQARLSGLIWIQTVCHSDLILEIYPQVLAENFHLKITPADEKSMLYYPGCKELIYVIVSVSFSKSVYKSLYIKTKDLGVHPYVRLLVNGFKHFLLHHSNLESLWKLQGGNFTCSTLISRYIQTYWVVNTSSYAHADVFSPLKHVCVPFRLISVCYLFCLNLDFSTQSQHLTSYDITL